MELHEAIKIVIEHANKRWGERHGIEYTLDRKSKIIERQTLWFIPFTEKNMKSQRWTGAQKGYIIDKETGVMLQPGSLHCLDTWIWAFELGFRGEPIDLTIKKIHNESKTIELLMSFGIFYVIPELENGIIWKISQQYSEEAIQKRLSVLPCTFKNQNLGAGHHILKEIVDSKAFEFEVKNTDYRYKNIGGELIDENNLIKE